MWVASRSFVAVGSLPNSIAHHTDCGYSHPLLSFPRWPPVVERSTIRSRQWVTRHATDTVLAGPRQDARLDQLAQGRSQNDFPCTTAWRCSRPCAMFAPIPCCSSLLMAVPAVVEPSVPAGVAALLVGACSQSVTLSGSGRLIGVVLLAHPSYVVKRVFGRFSNRISVVVVPRRLSQQKHILMRPRWPVPH